MDPMDYVAPAPVSVSDTSGGHAQSRCPYLDCDHRRIYNSWQISCYTTRGQQCWCCFCCWWCCMLVVGCGCWLFVGCWCWCWCWCMFESNTAWQCLNYYTCVCTFMLIKWRVTTLLHYFSFALSRLVNHAVLLTFCMSCRSCASRM